MRRLFIVSMAGLGVAVVAALIVVPQIDFTMEGSDPEYVGWLCLLCLAGLGVFFMCGLGAGILFLRRVVEGDSFTEPEKSIAPAAPEATDSWVPPDAATIARIVRGSDPDRPIT